jgi:hypothetical protein
MATGCRAIISAAFPRFTAASASPSAWMILARRSRSASAWLLRQVHLLHFHHRDFHPPRASMLIEYALQQDVQFLALLSNSSSSVSPRTLRRVVCESCDVA